MKKLVCSVGKLFVVMLQLHLVASQLPSDQVSAMTRIYEIIQNNTASSFVWNNVLKTSNPCSWMGVVCTSDNSSINTISFKSFSVSTSEFLPFLCNISTLESLDVSNNQLSSIPDSFFTVCGGFSGLKFLNFSGNRLIGSLPTFSGFEMLEILDFSRNLLSGEISLQLDGLGSLKILDLTGNQFIGMIPTNLGKMNLLEELVLSANMFQGEIPLEITKYKNLRVIDFSSNKLSGSVPWQFGEFTKLQTLILSLNSLSGEIPTSISNITTLQRFAANQNNFNGTIPLGISSFLKSLDLSYNNLRGVIPSDLISGANLEALDLSFNNLEGPIPAITSTKLFRLRLGSNALNGTIPSDSLGSHLNLMYLELYGNNLSGEIPLEIGMLRKLALLNLAQNRLRGTLPPSLGNLTNLQVLSLELNNFVGEIPPQFLQLKILEKLNISRNSLDGSIPVLISRMQNIRNLDLQGNNLRGPIPESIGNLSNLLELQLGNNQLNGRIPSMPRKLQIALNLSYNLFEGPIPFTLLRLQNLEILDLSNNRFSGEIPSFLTDLGSLTHLLLMNNRLSGEIPNFRDHLVMKTTGNSLLVDRHAKYPISLSIPRRFVLFDSNLGIAVASGFPVGLLISVISIFISRRYYNSIHGNLSTPNSTNVDFKKGMEAAADPSNITLKTSFSTFYKAVMPSGSTYMVKKINHSRKIFQFPRHKDLVEELELLGSLSNPCVMIPVAYVLTPRRAYLFYDFVRGTLHDILHRATGNSTLEWPSRYSIAVGVAQGLAFLHECSSGPIILLDLSTKTILLKSIDKPQISDIELCRVIHPSTDHAASAGYVHPEYGCTKRVTGAGNVYSFGVVLLELLTGKPAVSEGSELAKWVLSSSNCHQILDSSISETETSTVVRDQMLGVLEVAIACINMSPEMRPNMANVVQMLLNTRSS